MIKLIKHTWVRLRYRELFRFLTNTLGTHHVVTAHPTLKKIEASDKHPLWVWTHNQPSGEFFFYWSPSKSIIFCYIYSNGLYLGVLVMDLKPTKEQSIDTRISITKTHVENILHLPKSEQRQNECGSATQSDS